MDGRRRSLASLAICSVLAAGALSSAAAANAQSSGTVTLIVSASQVTFGTQVTLTATVDPAASGQLVAIVDETGRTIASGTTGTAGRFKTRIEPRRNVVVHANANGFDSSPVSVLVDPVLTVQTGTPLLLADLVVRGRFQPARPGVEVRIRLLRAGQVVATKKAAMGDAGRFVTTMRIGRIGTYRVEASLDVEDLQPGAAHAVARVTPLPDLAIGARGPAVSTLERRLVELRYRLSGVDDVFDHRTADAVMAFRKVQRMPRTQTVTSAVWRALARPEPFVPQSREAGFHLEVDQTRQVLATVLDGEVLAVFHVSTGKASTPTRDGTFRVFSKLAGFSSKRLYYPSFFDGGRAIHGWTDVPTYPASHGCVRVPYWIAIWIFEQADYGTPVVVYH